MRARNVRDDRRRADSLRGVDEVEVVVRGGQCSVGID
jgi:hypothetical protein